MTFLVFLLSFDFDTFAQLVVLSLLLSFELDQSEYLLLCMLDVSLLDTFADLDSAFLVADGVKVVEGGGCMAGVLELAKFDGVVEIAVHDYIFLTLSHRVLQLLTEIAAHLLSVLRLQIVLEDVDGLHVDYVGTL